MSNPTPIPRRPSRLNQSCYSCWDSMDASKTPARKSATARAGLTPPTVGCLELTKSWNYSGNVLNIADQIRQLAEILATDNPLAKADEIRARTVALQRVPAMPQADATAQGGVNTAPRTR